MKGKGNMDALKQQDIPQCYVLVRKLSLEEISRMTISPFFISNRCGRCHKFSQYGPKCTTCTVSYHYECAVQRGMCCELPILLQPKNDKKSQCVKCNEDVYFGPYCTVCSSKFHSYCLSPYEQCCELNICRLPPQRRCDKCEKMVVFGPKCPTCTSVYHPECVPEGIECCGNRIRFNDDFGKYQCAKCHRNVALGVIMCQYCGKIYHNACISNVKKKCCKRIPLELFLVPSFKYVITYYNQFAKRRQRMRKLEEMVVSHSHTLRSMIKDMNEQKRGKKKSAACQTSALDSIEIVSVKSELEISELDIPSSPPVLLRQSYSPEPSPSSQRPDSNMDGDDTLKNLFDFLYNMVKKFPPQLQTQVKIDLFKTVTEAEMKLQCDTLDVNLNSH